MKLKRVTTKDGEVYFIDSVTGERVKTQMDTLKSEQSDIFPSLPPYYQQEFQRIYESNEQYHGKWNWAAFFFTWIWALTKGAWGTALIILFIGYPLSFASYGLIGILISIIMGLSGNKIYYNVLMKKNLFPKNDNIILTNKNEPSEEMKKM